MFATCGCHPTRSSELGRFHGGADGYIRSLDKVITSNLKGRGRVVAVGECGLGKHIFSLISYPQRNPIDYDRLMRADAETQRVAFRLQLALAKKHHLPLFLHSRAAHADFVAILREEGFGEDGGRAVGGRGGVVHSFTGTTEEIVELVSPSMSHLDQSRS